jgi:putative heme-binding domain-containing protein
MRNWLVFVSLVFTLVAAEKKEYSAEQIETGRKLYSGACAACHGPTGEGGRGPKIADGRLIRGESDEKIGDVIRNGVPGADMPGFKLPPPQVEAIVGYLRHMTASAFDSAVPGDAAAGREIFGGKGECIRCHSIAGEGGVLGPDLSNIGAARTVRQLRESILDPSARPTDGFLGIRVLTQAGGTVEGVAKNYTNYSVQLLDASGKLHLLARQDVKSLEFVKGSLMPGDYGRRLSSGELQNLLAFLSRQSVRKGETAK